MTKTRVAGFSVPLDGFSAGPEQSLANPLGKNGLELFQWFFPTRTFRAMVGQDGGTTGVDDQYAQRSMAGFGAFILGRNMLAPMRNPWPDEAWKRGSVEGLVGRQPTVSRADLHPHAPRATVDRDGGRNHLALRDRWASTRH